MRQEDAIYETGEDQAPERAVLVGVISSQSPGESDLDELALLSQTAGATVTDRLVQRRSTIDASTFVGRGKVDELRQIVEATDSDLVIFDDELSPAQTRNIERSVGVRVIDRSVLILDIFARHARTHEAKLQVELAQLQYILPRLTRMWTHLGRPGGGIGTRGPGETQLEVDRRRIRTRIGKLEDRIEKVKSGLATRRKRRAQSYRVALVGYTNAGKSTLFNALTQSEVLVEDKLFATLDTTTRQLHAAEGSTLLLSDTVGFIRKLPHHLVASFRSTLDEVLEADLLLHVIDASSPNLEEQIDAVDTVLDELTDREAEHRLVLNKTDRVNDEADLFGLRARHPDAWMCSAHRDADVSAIRDRLLEHRKGWKARGGGRATTEAENSPLGGRPDA